MTLGAVVGVAVANAREDSQHGKQPIEEGTRRGNWGPAWLRRREQGSPIRGYLPPGDRHNSHYLTGGGACAPTRQIIRRGYDK